MQTKRLRVIVGIVMLGIGAVALWQLPVKEYLVTMLEWAEQHRALGAALLAVCYIPVCLFFLPGSPLSLGAGFSLGVVVGTLAVSVGSVAGATAAFVAGRTLARSFIEQRVAQHAGFTAIDRAVARQGFKIVLLTRLSPLFPFNLLNYAFALTSVRLRDYVLASWIGMLPGTVMYVYLGSAAKNLTDLLSGKVEGGVGQKALFYVGLLATVVVTVYVTRIARRALNEAVAEVPESSKPEGATE